MRQIMYASALIAGAAFSAQAATIEAKGTSDGVNIVVIQGRIDEGDSDKFTQIVSPFAGRALIFLNSPGGAVIDGLNIGLTIRHKAYATAVADSDMCASICGMIWLAGSPRLLTTNSKIGFHAASRVADGQESGEANALIGAYVSNLGLSYDAVQYLTEKPPGDMNWLHPSDATKVGIVYGLMKPTNPERPQTFGDPAPLAPAPTPVEQQARRLVQSYYAYWSQGGSNVEDLASYYSNVVSFYGGTLPREKVMDEKRKFSLRWPIRRYTINPESLFVQCNGDGCAVTGVVTWDVNSQERGVHSVGTANFALRIVNGVIVSENGSVLASHADSVEQQQASTTIAYAEGRQARIDYEQWFAALPDGGYRDGVNFWASHRSDKPQPKSCGAVPDWLAGCLAARARLNPIDIRRMTDKNFWWGWNSL
jgi:hypothetical protein